MAEIRKNKFTSDRNYYENMDKVHVAGTAAKDLNAMEYEEDFFENGEAFDEEYSEYDFETSPKKRETVKPEIYTEPRRGKKEKVKVLCFITMVIDMKAIGKMINKMEKEHTSSKMVIYMMENGKIMKNLEKENL